MTFPFRTLDDIPHLPGCVAVRLDLNMPIRDGIVMDLSRLERSVPTLKALLNKGSTIVILSHFGRPGGKSIKNMSLDQIVKPLAHVMKCLVTFVPTKWDDDLPRLAVSEAGIGDLLLMENTRFHPGEEENSEILAKKMARLAQFYVNDAFSVSHHAHASTEGIAHHLPSVIGRAMESELRALDTALINPKRPLAGLIGGAKISTKISILANLVTKMDSLIIGGGMANTFLKARGIDIGASLCEEQCVNIAQQIMDRAEESGCKIILPTDAIVAKTCKANVNTRIINVASLAKDDMILDIGPASVVTFSQHITEARSLIWNGPLGAFETVPFNRGTIAIAQKIAYLTQKNELLSVVGGGDTVSALHTTGVEKKFSYISMAGGAFLEWLEGKSLPGLRVLLSENKSNKTK
ncbi:MAG: phosphoglycerate kinase [Alphaproteobacteria bacterium]|nr:phosphoglycerate kinase [Alphaproteobacteria bacterium]